MDAHSMFLAVCLGVGIIVGRFALLPLLRRHMGLDRRKVRKAIAPERAEERARDEAMRAAWAELDEIDRGHGVLFEEPKPSASERAEAEWMARHPGIRAAEEDHRRLCAEVVAIAERVKGGDVNAHRLLNSKLRESQRAHAHLLRLLDALDRDRRVPMIVSDRPPEAGLWLPKAGTGSTSPVYVEGGPVRVPKDPGRPFGSSRRKPPPNPRAISGR